MLFIVGLTVVICSVVGGYTMHGGNILLLMQTSEFIIIFGSGIGVFLISYPMHVVVATIKSFAFLFRGHPYSRAEYLELIALFFELTKLMKTKGLLVVEEHIEHPEDSAIFTKFPSVISNRSNLNFICDNLRLILMGIENPYQIENMIDAEIDVNAMNLRAPAKAMINLGDSFPALGIVAAVLGVIITMRSIAEPPEILGGLIAAALVGTFLGVLLSYGLLLPIGHFVAEYAENQILYLYTIKTGIIGYVNGNPPAVIAEFMRKTVPDPEKPSFQDVEKATGR